MFRRFLSSLEEGHTPSDSAREAPRAEVIGGVQPPRSAVLSRITVGELIGAVVFRVHELPDGTPVHVLDAGGWGDTYVDVDRDRLAQLLVIVFQRLIVGAPAGARAYLDFSHAATEGHVRLGLHVRPAPAMHGVAPAGDWALAERIAALHDAELQLEAPGRAMARLPIAS